LAVTTSGTPITEASAAIPDPVISLDGVTKRFGSHTVLKDITFDIPRGKISAVLGPSGTGKSVLLKNIIGLLRPEEGQIYVDGEPIVGIRHKDMLRIRRKFGVLFQDGALFGSMDLFDNIAFPLREHTKKSEKEIRTLVLEKAEMVGLVAHLPKLPGEISGGMRKRAGLARALILNPDIVFFDEPDSGLDPVRVAYLDELVKEVQRELGCTFFIITHNIESVKRTADYIGMLYRSSLVRFGPAEEMFNSSRSLVKQFLAGSNVGPIGMDEMVDAAKGDADVAALMSEPAPAAAPGWPDTSRPDTSRPDTSRPDTSRPDTSRFAPPPPPPPAPVASELALYDQEEREAQDAPAEVPTVVRRAKPRKATPRQATPPQVTPRKAAPRRSAAPVSQPDVTTAEQDAQAGLSEQERRQLAEEEARFRAAKPADPN
jgi:phospholipid/cholesterol/gamma-HCH transport system ATP-binding protein